jgi:hypothetical protein
MCARPILTAAICLVATSAAAQSPNAQPHCVPVGGSVMTNFIVDTDSTPALPRTLGTVTGDLQGAVSATLTRQEASGDLVVFTVHHHWTTSAGDRIDIKEAFATAKETVAGSGVYAIVSYPVTIQGGTGRFDHATGQIESIGVVDLNTGRTIFRYSGQVCFAAPLR